MLSEKRNKAFLKKAITIFLFLYPLFCFAAERERAYKGYTGTVHQFGLTGIYNITSNSDYSGVSDKKSFNDYGMGANYTFHDYLTRQLSIDLMTSITVMTFKAMETPENIHTPQKIIWPVDGRISMGPSENFQIYLGAGLQWNLFEKYFMEYEIFTGDISSKTIHQLSGNTTVGFNVFGPQDYMFHLNIGFKFHFAWASNDKSQISEGISNLTKDKSGIIVSGSFTVDLNRRKTASAILNYEYPLGTSISSFSKNHFFNKTQSISLGVLFRVGGTR